MNSLCLLWMIERVGRVMEWIEKRVDGMEIGYDEFSSEVMFQRITLENNNWGIVRFFREAQEDYSHIAKHWHRHMEWIIPVVGNAECWVASKRYIVSPGQMIIIASGVVHESRREDYAGPYVGYVVHLSEQYLASLVPEYTSLSYEPMPEEAMPMITSLASEIVSLVEGNEKYLRLKIQQRIDAILLLITEKGTKDVAFPGDRSELVSHAMCELQAHYGESFKMSDIALRLHVSYEHLSRLFKRETGISMTEYVEHLRMEKAKEEIMHTEEALDDIAHECGYSSYSSFVKKFRKTHGCNPSKMRQNKS